MTKNNCPHTDTIRLTPIGTLSSPLTNFAETPKNFTISDIKGTIDILPEYLEAMDGIQAGDTIVVLFWFHQARRDILRVHPRGDTNRPKRGVFATRSPIRPNPIAISELKVISITGTKIEVNHVDALDQTPVLDIKKAIKV